MIIMIRKPSLLFRSCYLYVQSSEIDKIKNSDMNPIKKVIKTAGYICGQGYNDAKIDIKYYLSMRKTNPLELSP